MKYNVIFDEYYNLRFLIIMFRSHQLRLLIRYKHVLNCMFFILMKTVVVYCIRGITLFN